MDTESLKLITDSHHWGALLPELLLGCSAVLLLFVDLLMPKARRWIGELSMGVQVVALGWLFYHIQLGLSNGIPPRVSFDGMLVQTMQSDLMRAFFIGCSLCITHLGMVYLRRRPAGMTEFHHIVLIATASLLVMIQSQHFGLFFVALETLTIGFYVLVAFGRDSRYSLEAGLKYLVMGAFSSGILLFGIALLYGAAGSPLAPMTASDPLSFAQLGAFIGASDEIYNNSGNVMVLIGAAMVLIGVAFKIGVVPFQIWVPDVYQGAPTPVTAFLAVASKAAGFYVLYLLLGGPFAALEGLTVPLLTVVAVMTLLFGNIAALGQRNVKRVMGLSGVAHAGILLMGILASLRVDWALAAVLFYLVVYALGSFGVFEVMVHVSGEEDAEQDIDGYDDLLRREPFLGGVLLTGLGSLAGIPPLAGFVAKLLLFVAAFKAELYLLVGVGLLGVVLSIYYYFGWMRAAVMQNPFVEAAEREALTVPTIGSKVLMSVLVAGSIVFGFYQGIFTF